MAYIVRNKAFTFEDNRIDDERKFQTREAAEDALQKMKGILPLEEFEIIEV
ncbi:hypothetical protein [Bacillus sp. 165]|uniref:hypothetical protein n=1 Tax=Bacillus sp. 165 TaxID=1529117 RepID=UPI001ADBF2E4|nr:hypothetical protein [Bacillus sp. 165]MBO9128608.1 hypothetical protein [Bacillus sp. 165]